MHASLLTLEAAKKKSLIYNNLWDTIGKNLNVKDLMIGNAYF